MDFGGFLVLMRTELQGLELALSPERIPSSEEARTHGDAQAAETADVPCR